MGKATPKKAGSGKAKEISPKKAERLKAAAERRAEAKKALKG